MILIRLESHSPVLEAVASPSKNDTIKSVVLAKRILDVLPNATILADLAVIREFDPGIVAAVVLGVFLFQEVRINVDGRECATDVGLE